MRPLGASLLAVTILLSACASGSGSTGTESGTESGPRRQSGNIITRAELEPLASFSAFDAVRRLRPRWLQSRGSSRVTGEALLPGLIVDRSPRGGIERLRDISAENVESIRFVPARDATTLYGTGYAGGLIEVTTRSR